MARRGNLVVPLLMLLAGCAGQGSGEAWDVRWPSAGQARDAAVAAARSPGTWAPLAGAVLLQAGDWDEEVSEWAADERPVFGDRAESWSDDLRLASNAAWLLSALPRTDGDGAALNLPGRARVPTDIGLYGLAAGTAWARVEAGRHHASDVLAGYALGHFVAAFVAGAFQDAGRHGARSRTLAADFQALPRGGAVTVRLGRMR